MAPTQGDTGYAPAHNAGLATRISRVGSSSSKCYTHRGYIRHINKEPSLTRIAIRLSLAVLLTVALTQATPAHIKNYPPKAFAEKSVGNKVPSEKPEPPAPAQVVPAVATQTETPASPAPVAAPAPPAPQYGCGSDPYMAQIYMHESGCSTTASNPSSGAYGLCQALPGYKMATAGADWASSWTTQNAWCVSYADSRYGSPAAAWAAWQAQGWW